MYPLYELLSKLKEYKWVNLTHEVTADIPVYPTFNPLSSSSISTIDDTGAFSLEYRIGNAHGTHIDAPNHFINGKRDLLDISQKERVLPLYVLHLEDKVRENPGYAVTVEDIKAFEMEYGEILEGSFVAFSSGWYKKFDDKEAFFNKDENDIEHTPGWSIPALEYLSRIRNVTAIGHETLNTDSGIEAEEAGFLVAQKYWLNENKYQNELLANLDKVPAVGSLIFTGAPHIKDAPGFPAEVFAVIPNNG
ncbi:cyclase family protein [Ornithinibacillus sp. 4-3]|uniref:Cyclase family protein n=1 Tax=Ornithinibacillus sp. 4-3 TaxID=3231488 RepID=A0AB39HRB3_9BACI